MQTLVIKTNWRHIKKLPKVVTKDLDWLGVEYSKWKQVVVSKRVLFVYLFWHIECLKIILQPMPRAVVWASLGYPPQIKGERVVMKVLARSMSCVSALFLSVVSMQAYAGVTGSDPHPTVVAVNSSDTVSHPEQNSVEVAGITGTDPRPTRGVEVAGITGTDPRPTRGV